MQRQRNGSYVVPSLPVLSYWASVQLYCTTLVNTVLYYTVLYWTKDNSALHYSSIFEKEQVCTCSVLLVCLN